MSVATYIGRFAPSPTGPLHFGSLIAALGSYLQARSQHGKWLVRIEDVDPPREVPGSADAILRALEAFGLTWDDTVLYQSTRADAYGAAVDRLLERGDAYRCRCSRRQVAQSPGAIYSGRCRGASVPALEAHSIRVRAGRQTIRFTDALQGTVQQCVASEVGDYVIRRRDGLYAYQLAVTLDDDLQGVTEVVRGCDLLHTTARQIHLRGMLELSQPTYMHLPLALDAAGHKLSKQTGAAALSLRHGPQILFQALQALCQTPPPELAQAPVPEQLDWAINSWNIRALQMISSVELDEKRKVLQTRQGAVPMADSNDQ